MYIERVSNRSSPPAILLRESTLENSKVKKRTLANLSSWPPSMVEKFQALLRGEVVASSKLDAAFDIVRSRPHGHVVAARYKLTLAKNSTSPLIVDPDVNPTHLPEQFQKVSVEVNTTTIREALKQGEELPFAHLGDAGHHIRVK